jgi:hypothetical protein
MIDNLTKDSNVVFTEVMFRLIFPHGEISPDLVTLALSLLSITYPKVFW